MRTWVAAAILLAAFAAPALAEKGARSSPGMKAVKDHWVTMVAGHVEATNDYARGWNKPELHAEVPKTWAEVPAKYKTPRIMRQLRAIARAPDVKLTEYGFLLGNDPARQVERTIGANGSGAEIKTQWRGGQSGGGQTWMVYPIMESVEKAPLEHFFLRGRRAAKATGKPAGERDKRLVERTRDPLAGVSDAQVERRMQQVAEGRYDESQAALLLLLDAQRSRAAK